MKKLLSLVLITSGLFTRSSFAQAKFNLLAILFENAGTNTVLKALGGPPGNTIPWQAGVTYRIMVKSTSSGGTTLTCAFDGGASEAGVLGSDGFACAIPNAGLTNGPHTMVITPSVGGAFGAGYQISGSTVFINPTIACSTGACVQAAINGALAGTASTPDVLDFGGSQISNCGNISLDAVKPYVTIKNLTLTGCTIGNTIFHATTSNVTLDTITVNNGTSSTSLNCGAGASSIEIEGSQNVLKNSTINGGTASAVFLGGFNNVVQDTVFNGVNSYNANGMTGCSGVYVAGYHDAVQFNTFYICNGSCVHLAPDTLSAPSLNKAGNNLVWGNLIQNSLNNSFVGTPYHNDGGSIYTGWNNGGNTNIQYNVIKTFNPQGFSDNAVCGGHICAAGLYFDNNTSYYTGMHNYVAPGTPGYTSFKINPTTYLQNTNGALQSGNRTSQWNTFVGTDPMVIQASMPVLNAQGKTVVMTSPDSTCPNTCNNTIESSGVPFTAGVGAEATLPAPQFLSPLN